MNAVQERLRKGGVAEGGDPREGSTSEARYAPSGDPSGSGARRPAERGIPSVNRVRSVQTRVSSALAFTLMAMLGGGFLLWYYRGTAMRPSRAAAAAVSAAKARASGEMAVPPLGRYPEPVTSAAGAATATRGAGTAGAATPDPIPLAEKLLSEPPTLEPTRFDSPVAPGNGAGAAPATGGYQGSYAAGASSGAPRNPWEATRARQLSGPVFAMSSMEGGNAMAASMTDPGAAGGGGTTAADAGSPLGSLLRPTATPAAQARVLPTRELLLPKGSFLDCTLETAMDSSLPGLATCVTATDTFSADGRVVLLERGTKLIGETRGEARRGSNRLFVLWSEARTPTGVVVELASPGTDALGRAGVAGEVERHFWERFGAAILISVIDGAIQAAVESARSGNSGTVVVGAGGAQNVMSEALKDTLAIPPTISVPQGSRIQILVARDLDFRSVYALESHPAAAP